MFCKNCGNEIKDGERFCAKCGTAYQNQQYSQPINNQPINSQPYQMAQPAKTNSLVVPILIVLIVVLIAGGVVGFIYLNGKNKDKAIASQTNGTNTGIKVPTRDTQTDNNAQTDNNTETDNNNTDAQVEDDLKYVMESEIDAMNSGDVNAYMETIDPTSAVYASTKDAMDKLFSQYTITANLDDFELISVNGDSAKVKTVITAEVSGAAKNRSTDIHTFTKVDGDWKISSTQNQKIENLTN